MFITYVVCGKFIHYYSIDLLRGFSSRIFTMLLLHLL